MARVKGFKAIQDDLYKSAPSQMSAVGIDMANKMVPWTKAVKARFVAPTGNVYDAFGGRVAKVLLGILPKSYFITRIMREDQVTEREAKSMLYRYCRVMNFPLIRSQGNPDAKPKVDPPRRHVDALHGLRYGVPAHGVHQPSVGGKGRRAVPKPRRRPVAR